MVNAHSKCSALIACSTDRRTMSGKTGSREESQRLDTTVKYGQIMVTPDVSRNPQIPNCNIPAWGISGR